MRGRACQEVGIRGARVKAVRDRAEGWSSPSSEREWSLDQGWSSGDGGKRTTAGSTLEVELMVLENGPVRQKEVEN